MLIKLIILGFLAVCGAYHTFVFLIVFKEGSPLPMAAAVLTCLVVSILSAKRFLENLKLYRSPDYLLHREKQKQLKLQKREKRTLEKWEKDKARAKKKRMKAEQRAERKQVQYNYEASEQLDDVGMQAGCCLFALFYIPVRVAFNLVGIGTNTKKRRRKRW